MVRKGEPSYIFYRARNIVNGGAATNDAQNHHIFIVRDDSSPVETTNSPESIDDALMKGLYRVLLT